MTFHDRVNVTAERMDDPRPGDRFSEMYSYWVKVIGRSGDLVLWRTSGEGADFVTTADEFRLRHAYGSTPGYWVRYVDDHGPYLSSAEVSAVVKNHCAAVAAESAKLSLDSCAL